MKIYFNCLKSTSRLILHKKNIDIRNDSLVLTSETDNSLDRRNFNWEFDSLNQFLIFSFEKEVFEANKNYSLSVKFTGYLQSDNIGFYKSSYTDQNGNTR